MINLRYEKDLSQLAMDNIAEAGLRSDTEVLWDLAIEVTKLLGGARGNVHVTSGHTENISLVLHSIYYYNESPRVICSMLDDPVLYTCPGPSDMHFDVCPSDRTGQIIKEEYMNLLGNKPKLAVITAVHEETGVISDVKWMADRAKAAGATVFLDASNAARYTDLTGVPDSVDIIALDSGRLGGPTGVACLWVREDVRIAPFFTSANPFTDFNSIGVAAMAGTLREAIEAKPVNVPRLTRIQNEMDLYMKDIPGVTVNCEISPRACHISSYHCKNVCAYTLHLILRKMGIYVAVGPEGYSMVNMPSPFSVMLHGEDGANSNIVIKLCSGITIEEVTYCARIIKQVYQELLLCTGKESKDE